MPNFSFSLWESEKQPSTMQPIPGGRGTGGRGAGSLHIPRPRAFGSLAAGGGKCQVWGKGESGRYAGA